MSSNYSRVSHNSTTHMIVYRVENEFEEGPYVGRIVRDFYLHTHYTGQPNSRHDKLLSKIDDISADYCYGFISRIHFKSWFKSKDRKRLKQRNFYLSLYEVPNQDVMLGSKQLVFKKNSAILVKRFKI